MTHGVHISAANVGNTHAGFVLTRPQALPCSKHWVVKTALEGGAVSLPTHLESYSNKDISERGTESLSSLFSLSPSSCLVYPVSLWCPIHENHIGA